jgi:DNA replication protein DnaC
MRTAEEVSDFFQNIKIKILQKCKKCGGTGKRGCSCRKKANYLLSAYEACIPRDFWSIKKSDVVYNKKTFKGTILNYVSRCDKALAKGYGLLIVGNNGSGKSFFLSYILGEFIKKGRFTYYTTATRLEYDLRREWKDRKISSRLEQMMGSDFVAIDELGKEKENKAKDNYVTSHVERFLKQRFDDGMPTLLASNNGYKELCESYGETFSSMIKGRYKIVGLSSRDYRIKLGEKMEREMGYDNEV